MPVEISRSISLLVFVCQPCEVKLGLSNGCLLAPGYILPPSVETCVSVEAQPPHAL